MSDSLNILDTLGVKEVDSLNPNERRLFTEVQLAIDRKRQRDIKEMEEKKKNQAEQKSKLTKVRMILEEMKSLSKRFDEEDEEDRMSYIDSVSLDHDYSILPDVSSDEEVEDTNESNTSQNPLNSTFSMPSIESLDSLLETSTKKSSTTIEVIPDEEDPWLQMLSSVKNMRSSYHTTRWRRTKNRQQDYGIKVDQRLMNFLVGSSLSKQNNLKEVKDVLDQNPKPKKNKRVSEETRSREPTPSRLTPSHPRSKLLRIDHKIKESIESYETDLKSKVHESEERIELLNEIIALRKKLLETESKLGIKRTRPPRRRKTKAVHSVNSSLDSSCSSPSTSVASIASSVASPETPVSRMSHTSLNPVPSPSPSLAESVALSFVSSNATKMSKPKSYESYIQSAMKRQGLQSSKASSSGYSSQFSNSRASYISQVPCKIPLKGFPATQASVRSKVLQWTQQMPVDDQNPQTPPTPMSWADGASDINPLSPIDFSDLDFSLNVE